MANGKTKPPKKAKPRIWPRRRTRAAASARFSAKSPTRLRWRPAGPLPMRALLVDPSLFTAPYDAGADRGTGRGGCLADLGGAPDARRRPPGDRRAEYVDEFFYRRVDRLTSLPGPLRAPAKGVAHALGLARLVLRVLMRKPDVVHFQWLVVPPLDALAIRIIASAMPGGLHRARHRAVQRRVPVVLAKPGVRPADPPQRSGDRPHRGGQGAADRARRSAREGRGDPARPTAIARPSPSALARVPRDPRRNVRPLRRDQALQGRRSA